MSTRLKMKCSSVKFIDGGPGNAQTREFTLAPVYGAGNESWSKWTPSGVLQFIVTNPDCESLSVGSEYFVDVHPVPPAAPVPEASPAT